MAVAGVWNAGLTSSRWEQNTNWQIDFPQELAAATVLGYLLIISITCAATPNATYTFKTVSQPEPYRDLELKLDVYGASSVNANRPIVMYIHGGALIIGDRSFPAWPVNGVDDLMQDRFLKAGYVFVSVDYRLAKEPHQPIQ